MTDITTEPAATIEQREAEPKRADVDQLLADADAEIAAARQLERQIIAEGRTKPREDESAPTSGIEIQVMCAVYEDEDIAPSRYVNPNRNKAIRIFELEFGRATPENTEDINWLVWHCLGRPGANGVRPTEPAIGAATEDGFRAWLDSVDFLHSKTIVRGKVS